MSYKKYVPSAHGDSNLPKIRQFDGHDWYSTKIHRRNLPHWELEGSTYFITIRVDSSLGTPFQNPNLAMLLVSTLLLDDKKKYLLHAYVIMPDHLHLIIKPLSGNKLAKIMQSLKGSSAFNINRILNRTGKFWQSESFDHLIKDEIDLRQKWD
jgi:putative transposase